MIKLQLGVDFIWLDKNSLAKLIILDINSNIALNWHKLSSNVAGQYVVTHFCHPWKAVVACDIHSTAMVYDDETTWCKKK